MNSTFSRAFLGFIVLTLGITAMALVALRAMENYAGAPWWAMLLIVMLALVCEVSVYTTTLHDPIHDWIREPKKAQEKASLEKSSYQLGYDDGLAAGKKSALPPGPPDGPGIPPRPVG